MNPLRLLIAAAAGYGIYKYSKMTPAQKDDLMKKGKSFIDKNLNGMQNPFGKKETATEGKF